MMKLNIDKELRMICHDIIDQNWTEKEWSANESDDWFQTENFCGGYDASKKAFSFNYYNNDKTYCFQFPLQDARRILGSIIREIDLKIIE